MTLTELLKEIDSARLALEAFDMTNHYAYLKWQAAVRIDFDVRHEQARQRLYRAQDAYRAAIRNAAANTPEDETP